MGKVHPKEVHEEGPRPVRLVLTVRLSTIYSENKNSNT